MAVAIACRDLAGGTVSSRPRWRMDRGCRMGGSAIPRERKVCIRRWCSPEACVYRGMIERSDWAAAGSWGDVPGAC